MVLRSPQLFHGCGDTGSTMLLLDGLEAGGEGGEPVRVAIVVGVEGGDANVLMGV